MAIITISRGAYSKGVEIAEKVALKLGGSCISRESLLETSEEFNTTAMKLISSYEDIPSIFDRFKSGKQTYINYIEAALLKKLKKDNTVYHGFAGHYFVKEIPHALKVAVFAKPEDRIKIVMNRDNISEDEAVKFLEKIDKQRRSWSRYLYGMDIRDASQYDLVLNLNRIDENDAVDTICRFARSEQFMATKESQVKIENLALAAQVRAAFAKPESDVEVSANQGTIILKGYAKTGRDADKLADKAEMVRGVKEVINEIEIRPDTITAWGAE